MLITSEVTFVGENYHQLILPLAQQKSVVGLIVIRNRHRTLAFKGALGMLSLAAPRFGFQLFWNNLFPGTQKKIEAYEAAGKKVYFTDDVNSHETLELLKGLCIDLLVNARSRCFFREAVLALPPLGCINIHHGLLPDQRGVMCDFWAHLQGEAYGFTIHQMTKKIDDGAIIRVQEGKCSEASYTRAIFEGSKSEAEALMDVLNEIEKNNKVIGTPNLKTAETKYFKNPSVKDFYRLRIKGIKV